MKVNKIIVKFEHMKENNMTTIIVHNIITSQTPHHPLFNNGPIVNMQYEHRNSPNYSEHVRDRIRSKSFYNDKQRNEQNKKINKQRTFVKFGQRDQHSYSQPKVIDLQFDSFKPQRRKKEVSAPNKSVISTHEYYSLMVDSMQMYIKKIEKGKKKRLEKCDKLKSFGVNIQAIKVKSDSLRLEQFTSKSNLLRKKFEEIQQNNDLSILMPRQSNNHANLSNNQVNYNESNFPQQSSQQFNYHPHYHKTLTHKFERTSQLVLSKQKSLEHESIGTEIEPFKKAVSVFHSNKKVKFTTKKIMIKSEKKDQVRNIQSKLKRMYLHFSTILNSFGVYLDRKDDRSPLETQPKAKKEKKYTYFVGKGNNKNLIVSIFKKRGWWTEAQDMSSANFVWTQLKISSVLQRQASMAYSELPEVEATLYHNETACIKERQCNISYQPEKAKLIFHPNHATPFYGKLSQIEQRKFLRAMKVPSVVHNHYEANFMLGNKKALYYNMLEYKGYKNQNVFEFMPLTFHIEKINSRAFKQFEKKAKDEKKSLWIVKPGENSNRGQGIFVSDSFEAIKSKIEKSKKHTFIIQKYIKNNLTFNRRKFDIRTYVLMVSIGGVQKFFWYSEGYLRTASEVYDLSDLDDPFIHLTNDAIQANGDNYGKFEKGNKITYSQFQRYLDLNYPNEKYLVSNLVQRMKGIAKQVVEATYFKLDPCRKEYCFQLFGLDFLVDSMFRPWLLEVNTNPCLELSSPVLERLIPRMLENMFRMVVDPVFQPLQSEIPRNLACYIPENIIESNRFELIFDSLHDREGAWQQYSKTQYSQKVYEDENEEFENDGEIIKIQD